MDYAQERDAMTKHPSHPHFSHAGREELLRSMGRSLSLSRVYGASKGHNSLQYQMADSLRDAITALATDLTDDPHYYGDQPETRKSTDQADCQ
jgi:hypothetical protein